MREDKQWILDLLLPALKATCNLHDLADLEYDPEREEVIATFDNGYHKYVNVAADSGTAMIVDVVEWII